MDEILAKASSQAMTFAIRSGISLASGFAIKKVSQLLDKIPPSEKARLENAKVKLSRKTAILSSSIDLIKLSAARGNSALETTVEMVTDLKDEIDSFESELDGILQKINPANEKELIKAAEHKISALLDSINDAIPLINLALITSGVNFGTAMDPRVSPSRLLQASSYIDESNKKYDAENTSVSVGPTFDLKLFSVFYNPSRLKYVDERPSHSSDSASDSHVSAVSWKEEFARASCRLERVKGQMYQYELVIREDLDDGRYHDEEEGAKTKRFKIQHIRKQFFSASGKLLRLEGSNSPVLTLKVQGDVKVEYVALGEVGDDFDVSDDEEDTEEEDEDGDSAFKDAAELNGTEKYKHLSLLETLIRLASLQESEQQSILEIKDEKLSLYLHDLADKSAMPLSHVEKARLQEKIESRGHALEMDSSVNRLKSLSLKDEAGST